MSIEVPSAVSTCIRDLSSSLHVTMCDTGVTRNPQTQVIREVIDPNGHYLFILGVTYYPFWTMTFSMHVGIPYVFITFHHALFSHKKCQWPRLK